MYNKPYRKRIFCCFQMLVLTINVDKCTDFFHLECFRLYSKHDFHEHNERYITLPLQPCKQRHSHVNKGIF